MGKTWELKQKTTGEATADNPLGRPLTHLEKVIYRAVEKMHNMRGLPEPYNLDDVLWAKIDRLIKKILVYAEEHELGTLRTVTHCAFGMAMGDLNFLLQLLTYRLMETYSLVYCHNLLVHSLDNNAVVEIPQWVVMDDEKKRWADEGRIKQLLHFVDSRLKDRGVLKGGTRGAG